MFLNAPFLTWMLTLVVYFGGIIYFNSIGGKNVQLKFLLKVLIPMLTLWGWFWAWVKVSATIGTATAKSGPHAKYGAVHLATTNLEQWLCCTATRQIAKWVYLFFRWLVLTSKQLDSICYWLIIVERSYLKGFWTYLHPVWISLWHLLRHLGVNTLP